MIDLTTGFISSGVFFVSFCFVCLFVCVLFCVLFFKDYYYYYFCNHKDIRAPGLWYR